MKKLQILDAIRNIQKSMISYLSLCLVVTLGIGGFLMSEEIIEGLRKGAAGYYEAAHFQDMEVISTVGFTEDDIANVLRHEEITEAEGVVLCGGTLSAGGETFPAELSSLSKVISVPSDVVGRLPNAKNECTIGRDLAKKANLSIGDTAEIRVSDTFSPDALKETTFLITGLTENPAYIRSNSTYHVYLAEDAWNTEITHGLSTRLYLRTDVGTERNLFSSAYQNSVDEQKKRLMPFFETLADDQKDTLEKRRLELMNLIGGEARAKLEEAEQAIKEGEQTLAEKEEAIKNGETALLQAEQEAAAQIAEYEQQIREGKELLEQGKETLISGQWKYEAGLIELKDGEEQFQDAIGRLRAYKSNLKKYYQELAAQVEKGSEGWNMIIAYRNIAERYKDEYERAAVLLEELDGVLIPSESYYKDIAEITRAEVEAVVLGDDPGGAEREGKRKRAERTARFHQEVTEEMLSVLMDNLMELIDYLEEEEYIDPEPAQEYRDSLVKFNTCEKLEDLLSQYGMAIGAQRGLNNSEDALKEAVSEAEEELEEAEIRLGEGREQLKAASGELDSGWAQYYEKTEELAESEKKLEEEKLRIRAALQEEREKLEEGIKALEKGRAELQEAKAAYESAKAEYEKSSASAGSFMTETNPTWIVRTSPTNSGFLNLVSVLSSISGAGLIFSVLFLLISSVAYASALVLNIRNQTKQIGTAKGFGFFNSEIIMKFLIFSVSAAAVGSLLSIGFAGMLSRMFLRVLDQKEIYFFSAGVPGFPYPDGIFSILGAILIGFIATMLCCRTLMTTPTAYLMRGLTLGRHIARSKTAKISKKGSLYLHLIFRNMKEDISRVSLMSIIIAGSVILMGLGFVLKDGYEGMLNMQVRKIFRYDLLVSLPDSLDEAERSAFQNWLSSSGCDYTSARSEPHFYEDENRTAGTILIAADESIHPFIRIADPRTKKETALPDDGLLAPQRFMESKAVSPGDAITIYDSLLTPGDAVIRGSFENYFGSYFFISKEGYRKLFGYEPEDNTYYLQFSGNNPEEVRKAVSACSDKIRIDTPDSIYDGTASISFMYSLVILLLTLIGALLAFIILTNLISIYLTKKKKEVAIMRINGFTLYQCMRYLSQEIVIVTLIGLLSGTLIGVLVSPLVCRLVQPIDGRFLDAFNPRAWLFAFLIEALFVTSVSVITFRQVDKFNMLEDIIDP